MVVFSKPGCDHREASVICSGSGNLERPRERAFLPGHQYDPGQVIMLPWNYYSGSIVSSGFVFLVFGVFSGLDGAYEPSTHL